MLIRNILMRFAFSDPPLRERRELMFAQDKSHPANPANQSPESGKQSGTERRDGRSGSESIQDTSSSVHHQYRHLVENLDAQELFDELLQRGGSTELFDQLAGTEDETMTEKEPVQRAARRAGITGIDWNDIPEQAPGAALSAILDADTRQTITPNQKQEFLSALMEHNPQMTLALANGLARRLVDYEADYDRLLQWRKDVNNDRTWIAVSSKAAKVAKRMMIRGTRGEERPFTVDDALAELRTEGEIRLPNGMDMRLFLENVSDAMRTLEDFGGRYWGSAAEGTNADEEQRRKGRYVQNIREQVTSLLRLMELQLQEHGEAIANALTEGCQIITGRPEENIAGMDAAKILDHFHRVAGRLNGVKETLETPRNLQNAAAVAALTAEASKAANQLFRIKQDAQQLVARWRSGDFSPEQIQIREHSAAADRLTAAIPVLAKADPTISGTPDRNKLMAWTPEMRAGFELIGGREERMQEIEQQSNTLKDGVEQELDSMGTRAWLEETRKRFLQEQTLMGKLLGHPICSALSIPKQVQIRVEACLQICDDAMESGEAPDREELLRAGVLEKQLAQARSLMERLERDAKHPTTNKDNFVALLPKEEFLRQPSVSEKTVGFTLSGKIYLRQDLWEKSHALASKTLEHEKAHMILWILGEESLLLPTLLHDHIDALGPVDMSALEAQAHSWGVDFEIIKEDYRRAHPDLPPETIEERARERYQRELLEEGIVRRAMTEDDSHARPSAKERKAMDALAPRSPGEPAFARKLNVDDEEPPAAPDADTFASSGTAEARNCMDEIEQIEAMLLKIETFGKAYPQFKDAVTRAIGTGSEQDKPAYIVIILKSIQRTGKSPDGSIAIESPETNADFIKYIQQVKEYVTGIHNKVAEFDKEAMDLEKVEGEHKMSINEKLGIRWLCILDIIRIWKELKEDITGMWTTDQDRKTSEYKADLYKNLPVYFPGTKIKIPILGKYTERLPHYAERRKNDLELQRVKKWEDAFTNLDSGELMDLIGSNPTKDQLRASIQLLVKKGLMNWGDKRLWKALSDRSAFKMPHGPCSRDENLRDLWIHKLVTDIWSDKEMFEEWKTSNDGNFDKHKSAYTHSCDNFSNISGKMGDELQSILSEYVHHLGPDGMPSGHMPEHVNPHHYEELLHYAMRNGKMTMEGKIYYLVQGLRYGLIGIDRMRVLAGEKGALLTKFPFLDYFYQRHNTIDDFKKIGERLDEGDGNFKPGTKTTIFLRYILLRDSETRKRIVKATDKKAEEFDHEDVPYLVTDVSVEKMKNLLGNFSGERWKITALGWKNAYVGFGEKFKIYGHIAQMAENGKAFFSSADVNDLAQSVASYVVMDNKLTGAAKQEKEAVLSEQDFDDTTVSNSNFRTREFRLPIRSFIADLMTELGINKENVGENLTVDQYIAGEQRDKDARKFSKEQVTKIIGANGTFVALVVNAIRDNPAVLQRMLRRHANAFKDSSSDPSNANETKLTYGTVERQLAGISI